MSRSLSCALLCVTLLLPSIAARENGLATLYRSFLDPAREYSVRPFWFWNGKLDAAELDWQIRQMAGQGVYGAYVHNRTGLETPYLSEDYFAAVKGAFESARSTGFLLGFVDEYEWPSGEARDVWQPGLPSRVIASNPDFRMRSLGYVEKSAQGPERIDLEAPANIEFAVAARLTKDETIVPDSLALVTSGISGRKISWQAPEARSILIAFCLQASRGKDGGMVDLLNHAAIRKFLDLSYEEYYRRFGERFGTTMDSTYVDHEGDYGNRIAWTPVLFETFQKMKGYDLRKYLPLLMYDGGNQTPKVRCDYLDVISELYTQAFFKQVTEWCEAHRIKISGHVWEENLQMEAAFEGDLQRIMRAWAWPGVDSLWDHGRLPRDFKAAASVAHFRGTRFTCENQGLHGADSFLDFQKMRLGTNMIGAWGVNLFIPHAFNYNRRRIEYPPNWFYQQPYWKYFKHYADYARRISYMNAGGLHVADVLVYQPTESAWAHSEPVFSSKFPYIPSKFNNPLDTINTYYTNIQNRLAQERWDFDVADSHFLSKASLKDRRLVIGDESFRVLILPPITTIRRDALAKIAQFYDEGGIVVGMKFLPDSSMEQGRGDSVVAETVRHIFGDSTSGGSRTHDNASGGRAFFIGENVEEIFRILEGSLKQDVRVLEQSGSSLFYLHRRKESTDFYWLVNDSQDSRDATVLLATRGIPEKWDAADGARSPLYYRHLPEGTEVRLHFDPWEAYYVVFSPLEGPEQVIGVSGTDLERYWIEKGAAGKVQLRGLARLGDNRKITVNTAGPGGQEVHIIAISPAPGPIELKGAWSFKPENNQLPAPYADVMNDTAGEGEIKGWHARDFNSNDWPKSWLSRERLTVKDWWLIGPFPNEDHRGFSEAYPPEKGIDLNSVYTGIENMPLSWKKWASPGYAIDLPKALGFSPGRSWVTCYGVTYIFANAAKRVQFRVAADNNAKLWVNGKSLLDWHIHPFYYEMREDFAYTRVADLVPGWNEVLVKVSKGAYTPSQYAFLLRVTDEQGNNLEDLFVNPDRLGATRDPRSAMQGKARTWYRIPVPASAAAVQLPPFHGAVGIFYNGERIKPDASGFMRFPQPAQGSKDVLAVSTGIDDVFADCPKFILGQASLEAGSWIENGLPYYSGSAAYERDFDLPGGYLNKKLILDCGQVGVVAEAWINDKPAGVRVWLPFSFDISKLIQPGKNHLKIVVTNTMENERAVENHAKQLSRLQLSGLLGPIRIVPYEEISVDLVSP